MNIDRAKKIIIEELYKLYELTLLGKAEDLAQYAHLGQKRKSNKPYIIHPKRVQLLAKTLGYSIEIQVAALLHDVIEEVKNKEYFKDLIRVKFGQDMLNLIILLSHSNDVEYYEYLKSLAKSKNELSKKAFKVKMLDMLNNLTDYPIEKSVLKYKDAIQQLINENLANDVPDEILKILKLKTASNETLSEAPKDTANKSKDAKKPDVATDKPDSSTQKNDANVSKPEDTANQAPDAKDDADISLPGDTPSEPSDEKNDSPDVGGGGGGAGIGGDIFGDTEGGPDGAPDEAGADENQPPDETSVVKYNDKLNKSKVINFQRSGEVPEFEFDSDDEFYRTKLISGTKNGSLLIAIPSIIKNNMDVKFIEDFILPKIIQSAYTAIKNDKDVIFIGDYGLPYYNGKYTKDASGIIAKVLNDLFKGTITFDTWNPKDYQGFISNSDVWKELKKRTEASNSEIKAALYLFLLATDREGEIINKLKTDNVEKVLLKWELPQQDLNMQLHKDDILRTIFPDKFNNAETIASYIIKLYLQLLKVNMLKKVIQYEKEGKVVIVPTDSNSVWSIADSFKKLDKLHVKPKPKESPKAEKDTTGKTPETTPEKEAGTPPPEKKSPMAEK